MADLEVFFSLYGCGLRIAAQLFRKLSLFFFLFEVG